MATEDVMTNIEIRDFQNVSSVALGDNVVISLVNGTSALIEVELFKNILTKGITPSINDKGVWLIGETNTEVVAEGQTPQFRKTELGIEWKYTSQPSTAWTLLVPIGDILFKFSDLTDSQREAITLKFSDLTEEEIAELQKPANDMIAILKATDDAAVKAEAERAAAETARVEAENARKEAEALRVKAETERDEAAKSHAQAESSRQESETQRASSESERKSAETARISSETTRESNENTRIAQEEARVEAERERVEAESARVTAEEGRADEFARLKSESEAATASANDTADHPTYIGEDNYVYKWNKGTKTYDKTSVYVRGEAFSIKKVYGSVSEMYADTTTAFKEGDFALIDTGDVENPENGQLFVRSAVGSWDFLVDLSGAIGFTGKTPQLFIGSVNIGSGKESAAVSLTSDGIDSDGNPQYRIHYTIPCLAYEDLTGGQIAELQRPASEMIAALRATDESVKEAETLRAEAEAERIAAENLRKESEALRDSAERERAANEETRKTDEETRAASEIVRQQNEQVRKEDYADIREDAVQATGNANNAAAQARNLPKIQDGTWWLFDVEQNIYVDSGYAVSSDYQLTKEKVENVLTGDITTHRHDIYINKVDGMGLSANDFTDALKEKLEKLENYDDSAVTVVVNTLREDFDELVNGDTSAAIESFNEIMAFLDGVSDAETLEGIVAAIEKQIAEKADKTALPTKLSELDNDVPYATQSELTAGLAEKQPVISDLEAIRSGAALGATAVQEHQDLSAYAKVADVNAELAKKQPVISDLDAIRSGAALGATAIQEHQDLSAYAKASDVNEGLAAKQDKNLYFVNLTASEWTEDASYEKFGYRCDLPCPGVTADYYAEVIFAMDQFTDPDYAPICETKEGIVSIWSAKTDTIVIPTIIIYK